MCGLIIGQKGSTLDAYSVLLLLLGVLSVKLKMPSLNLLACFLLFVTSAVAASTGEQDFKVLL